jgi:CubicO group peptidase (beta-lactamase class C family)
MLLPAHAVDAIDAAKLMAFTRVDKRVENFRNMDRVFPVETIRRSEDPYQFKEAIGDLDFSFEFDGQFQTLAAFLEKTVTTSLLVLKDDVIVYEQYFLGNDRESRSTSMSVAKSFTSALIGIAVEEGHIESIDDSVGRYVPELKDSGYADVPIDHVLQMSSGIDFSEEYDKVSDATLMMYKLAGGGSVSEYAAALESRVPSGEVFNYASIDTTILGMILERTTGMNPAQYMEEKIWQPIGMESDATWGTDNAGTVLMFAYLNVTTRDYAKFGRLYLENGVWDGEQIVPTKWVQQSRTIGRDFLKLKGFYGPEWDVGYKNQWWIPEGDEGEFTGIGIWGQYIYVNPARNIVIVKTSVDPLFDDRDLETIAAFQAIGRYLDSEEAE